MMKEKLKDINKAWYFLMIVLLGYIILFCVNKESFFLTIDTFISILTKIIPIFILVFVLMAITNYFITPKFISKHIETDKGIKKWVFAVVGGILSTGPIYMWYPLLADLREKGLSNGLIACFLYNRAVKIPLIPLMIIYFKWQLVIVLTFVMILASLIQGFLINKFTREEKQNENSNSI